MSNVIEFKLKKPIKEATVAEIDEALDQLEQIQVRIQQLRTQLIERWLVIRGKSDE